MFSGKDLFRLCLLFDILIMLALSTEDILRRYDYFYAKYIRPVQPPLDRIPDLHAEGLFEGDIEGEESTGLLAGERNGGKSGDDQKSATLRFQSRMSRDFPSQIQNNILRDKSYHWPRSITNDATVDIPFTIDRAFRARERAVIAKAMKNITGIAEDASGFNATSSGSLRTCSSSDSRVNKRSFKGHPGTDIYATYDNTHSRTCIRFVSRNAERDYLFIEKSRMCSSWVGRVGGKQIVKLSRGCMISLRGPYLGIVQHELLHALGFWHEHTRPDRDEYVKINWDLIPTFLHLDYAKKNLADVSTLNLPYDYGSVMHYKGNRGMTAIDPKGDRQMGNRVVMSEMDAQKVNALYRCGQAVEFSLQESRPDNQRRATEDPIGATTVRRVFDERKTTVAVPKSTTSQQTAKPQTRGPDKLREAGMRPALWTCIDTNMADCEELRERTPDLCDIEQVKCSCMATCELCNTQDCEGTIRTIAEENAAKFSGFCSDFIIDCETRILNVGWDRFCRNLINKCQCRSSCNACSFNRCPAPGIYRNHGFGRSYRISEKTVKPVQEESENEEN